MSEEEQQHIQRLPQLAPQWIVLACALGGVLVDLATGPSVFETLTLFRVAGVGVSLGGVVAALACVLYGVWEAWYR